MTVTEIIELNRQRHIQRLIAKISNGVSVNENGKLEEK